MAKILITRPNHDEATNYLYFWTSSVIKEITKKGITIYALPSKKAAQKNFVSYLKNNQGFIFFNGHGSKEVITGQDNEILVDTTNASLLSKTKIVYARACQAGKILGQCLVNAGTKAFIGYTNNFVFLRIKRFITHPLDDFLARLFLEPSNLVATTIVKGHSANEANNRSLNAMRKNLQFTLSSMASAEEQAAASYLWSNINCQVIYGDVETKIT